MEPPEDGKVVTIVSNNIFIFMKKSELTQLTQIIEHLIKREVRKQLPTILSEVLQNMSGKTSITEGKQSINQEPIHESAELNQPINFKSTLRELFAGTPVMKNSEVIDNNQPKPFKQFAKDPVLNKI